MSVGVSTSTRLATVPPLPLLGVEQGAAWLPDACWWTARDGRPVGRGWGRVHCRPPVFICWVLHPSWYRPAWEGPLYARAVWASSVSHSTLSHLRAKGVGDTSIFDVLTGYFVLVVHTWLGRLRVRFPSAWT